MRCIITQVIARSVKIDGGRNCGREGICREEFDQVVQVFIEDTVLASQIVLHSDGERFEQVDNGFLLD